MVLPLTTLLGGALSPLQGLGFGFGYGYGVRLGYHSFKPSKSKDITGMRLSANPKIAGVGMGLASADEMMGGKVADNLSLQEPQSQEPSISSESARMVENPDWIKYNPSEHQVADANLTYVTNKCGEFKRNQDFKSYEEKQLFMNKTCSRRSYSQKAKYRY